MDERGETRRALLSHLQTAFQRLDKRGKGEAPTDQLVRALRTLLASQAASLKASRGWASGLKQMSDTLDGRLDAARSGVTPGAVEGLVTGWEELLELAEAVNV